MAAHGAAHPAVRALGVVPWLTGLLGGDGRRRYLVGAQNPAQLRGMVDALATLGQGRHIILYSEAGREQRALRELGMAGDIAAVPASGEVVSVVVNNAVVNKVDRYVDRRVAYEVAPQRDGSSTATLRVTFFNDAPARGPGAYVLGPNRDGLRAGDDLSLVSIFCGRCEPTAARPSLTSGSPASGTVLDRELEHTVATAGCSTTALSQVVCTSPRATRPQIHHSRYVQVSDGGNTVSNPVVPGPL